MVGCRNGRDYGNRYRVFFTYILNAKKLFAAMAIGIVDLNISQTIRGAARRRSSIGIERLKKEKRKENEKK